MTLRAISPEPCGTHASKSLEATLSDPELLRRVLLLAGQERGSTVELVRHLAELDARRLHVREGFGSLFAYCTTVLKLGEHAAYNRIEAARLSRRFPFVLDRLRDGSLNLSTLRLLAPHLRPENVDAVMVQAGGRSKREVEALVAALAPRPDAASCVRRLPVRGVAQQHTVETAHQAGSESSGSDPVPQLSREVSAEAARAAALVKSPQEPAGRSTTQTPLQVGRRPAVAFLAPGRYRVQFTVDDATHRMLRQAQDLLRREIPDGDPGALFERALRLLLEDVARRKLAATASPRPLTPQPAPTTALRGEGSRHVPAHVKRRVWVRDGARCAFVSAGGRRCGERTFLEFHHCQPYALGGEATAENISLRCRAHNAYEAELVFGAAAARRGPRAQLAPGRVDWVEA